MSTRKHNTHDQTCPPPKGLLIAVGGHENKGEAAERGSNQDRNNSFAPETILKRFCDELQGDDPLIVIVPTASGVPEESAADYQKVFAELGRQRTEVLDIRNRADTLRPEYLELVEQAAGIWFTGGDQLRLTGILGGTTILRRLKERYTHERIVLGGTSAGATALSTPMIYEGTNNAGFRKGEIAITTGLQFMRDVAIDTHFIARGRIVRMAQILATNLSCVGIGLEEDTAVVVHDGRELEVIGSGLVTILETREDTSTNIYDVAPETPFYIRCLQLHFLSPGERYTLSVMPELHR
ncbi:cyanophycinase [Hymenobacter sp. GOD-10R]|uniref:cyanophycinase n=1 Tax=Hymenobacter sp. GOD-10R TaxID=3093922 RepID=UPI002D79493A|nr:cyanophycinase [Hymenobacter sp. GOD-10R]WRQ29075.1 cyanophycinase [Hymenobacter sp. GOD-10R]